MITTSRMLKQTAIGTNNWRVSQEDAFEFDVKG
jgi:hypothetical protein